MVGLAVGIAGLVYWQWRGDTRLNLLLSRPWQLTRGRSCCSGRRAWTTPHTVNRVPRYRVSADTNLGFEGGRQEWIENVRLALYSAPVEEGTIPDPTVITGSKLVVRQNQGWPAAGR